MIEYPRAILRLLYLGWYLSLFLDPAQGDFGRFWSISELMGNFSNFSHVQY